jgi:PIN like domain
LSDETRKQLHNEKSRRYKNKVPPGYKDASKDDGGIGDFLIWKTLLLLGEREKKDMAVCNREAKAGLV